MGNEKKTVTIHPTSNRALQQIDRFWKWFAAHEEALLNALRLGLDSEAVLYHFDQHLSGVSKRILCLIRISTDGATKSRIIFSAEGYRKLFPKILALELRAPRLVHFTVQAFIKPMDDKTDVYEGTDAPYEFDGYSLQISQLYVSLLDYDLSRKQLQVKIHIPEYEQLAYHDDLAFNLHFIVMELIGEIAYRKHVKRIVIGGMPSSDNGLVKLIALSDLIDGLYLGTPWKKTRTI